MITWVAFAAGVAVLASVWTTTARAVFLPPTGLPRRGAAVTVRLARGVVTIARYLPGPLTGVAVRACVPTVMLLTWVSGVALTAAGTALVAPALTGSPDPDVAGMLLLRGDEAVAVLGLLHAAAQALVCVAFVAYLVRFVRAYDCREKVLNRQLGRPGDPDDGEEALARYLAGGSREHFERAAAIARAWLADIRFTHQAQPLLLFTRPRGPRAWSEGAVVLLDAAALSVALAPHWTPPYVTSLLEEGEHCLPWLSGLLGIDSPRPAVSLHGREERRFDRSVALAVAAGVPRDRPLEAAWDAFQFHRRRYAPFAVAIQVAVGRPPTPVWRTEPSSGRIAGAGR